MAELLDADTATDVGIQTCTADDGQKTRALVVRTVVISEAKDHHRILGPLHRGEQIAGFVVGGGQTFVVLQEEEKRPRCSPGPRSTLPVRVVRCSKYACEPPRTLALGASTLQLSFAAFDARRAALVVLGDQGLCIEGDQPQAIQVCDLASWSCTAPAYAEGIPDRQAGYWTAMGAVFGVLTGTCGTSVGVSQATVGPSDANERDRVRFLRVPDNNGDDAAFSFDRTTESVRFMTHRQRRRSNCETSGNPATFPSLVACRPNGTCSTTDLREVKPETSIDAVVAIESKIALIANHATKLITCDGTGRKCQSTDISPRAFDSPRVLHVASAIHVLGADRIATCRVEADQSCSETPLARSVE